MRTFDFPWHEVQDRYPQSSVPIKFGAGYEFVSKPRGPDQVTFVLNFESMKWVTATNDQADYVNEPEWNLGRLVKFYEEMRLYKIFRYPHPRRGFVNVRFAKPFELPRVRKGGKGWSEAFTIELILQP